MSLPTASTRLEPTFNVSAPALPNHTFIYVDEESGDSVSWCPHPDLEEGIRDRLVDAVGRVPRKWLLPPKDGKVFNTY
jgi:hypothetical protein